MPNDKQHRDDLNRAVNYWLRSAASAEQCRLVGYNGGVNSNNATNNNSARPAPVETEGLYGAKPAKGDRPLKRGVI